MKYANFYKLTLFIMSLSASSALAHPALSAQETLLRGPAPSIREGMRLGGGSDGGACGVKSGGEWTLKDFVRGKVASRRFSFPQRERETFETGSSLRTTRIAALLGAEIMDGNNGTQDFRQTAAYQLATHILQTWLPDSPVLALQIKRAAQLIRFGATPHDYQPVAYGCQKKNYYPVAIYDPGYMATIISTPTWNRLPIEAQVGTVFKEALRFLQAERNQDLFSGQGLTQNTEQVLSEVVSTLVFQKPIRGQRTLKKIFERHGIDISSSYPNYQKLNDQYDSICDFGRKHWADFRCEKSHLGLDATRVEMHEMKDAVKDMSYQLMSKFNQSRNDDLKMEIGHELGRASDLQIGLSSAILEYVATSPDMIAAVKKLKEVTESLQTCAATSYGDRCKSTGYMNLDEVSSAIFSGNENDRSISDFIEKAQELLSKKAPYLFRN